MVFFVLDDENIDQILANILQVKERGATIIVFTNLADISTRINASEKIDYLVQLFPKAGLFASLLCCSPLLLICYFTAVAKGINPDTNLLESINIKSEFTLE